MQTKLPFPNLMTFARGHPNFTSTYYGLMPVYHCVLNVKVLAGAFYKEKALLRPYCESEPSFAALAEQ